MSSKVLWIHHFETMWADGLKKFGTSFEEEMEKYLDFIENNDFDKVIITRFEDFRLEPEHNPIVELCRSKGISLKSKEYGYGWTRDEENDNYKEEDFGKKWCHGKRDHHSEDDVVEIEKWHHNFKRNSDKVYLAGAFVGECLADAEAVLEAVGVDYELVDSLSVGSGVEYEFIGNQDKKELESEIYTEIAELENEINDFMEEHDLRNLHDILKKDPEFYIFISEEINEIVFDNLDEILEHDISPESSYQELQEAIDFIIENESPFEDMKIVADDQIELNESTLINEEPEVFYHGTFWEFDQDEKTLDSHADFSVEYSELRAIYLSNSEQTCEFFSGWNTSEDNPDHIKVVFKINMPIKKSYVWDVNTHQEDIRINDSEFNVVSDREELYQSIRGDFDAFVIKNNYSNTGGDDIAYFNDIEEDKVESVKVFIDDAWTNHMDVDEAREFVENYFLEKLKPKNKKRNKMKVG